MTPGYNIRVGKAADRLLFREMLLRLAVHLNFDRYRYIGLGGPFLEDFRLVHDAFPGMKLTSIESKEHVWHRQQFHKPARHVELKHCTVDYYFSHLYEEGRQSIAWLDYTDLRLSRLEFVGSLVKKLAPAPGSIIRVTLRAEGADAVNQQSREQWATEIFGPFRPDFVDEELDTLKFPNVLLRGIKRATDTAEKEIGELHFQPLHAFVYDDGTQMLTFCGMVCTDEQRKQVRSALKTWEFKNLDWSDPHELMLPALSLKERLFLEPHLPSRKGTGKKLHKALGYSIEGSPDRSVKALDQYRRVAEAYPRFVRASF